MRKKILFFSFRIKLFYGRASRKIKIEKKFENRFFQIARFLGVVPLKGLVEYLINAYCFKFRYLFNLIRRFIISRLNSDKLGHRNIMIWNVLIFYLLYKISNGQQSKREITNRVIKYLINFIKVSHKMGHIKII